MYGLKMARLMTVRMKMLEERILLETERGASMPSIASELVALWSLVILSLAGVQDVEEQHAGC